MDVSAEMAAYQQAVRQELDRGHMVHAREAHNVAPGEVCPTCDTKKPYPRVKSEAPRKRATWSISVPKDHQENGAAILDELIEIARDRLREPLGVDDGTPKYHIIVPVLAAWIEGGKADA